jgi:oligopeptide/dipeptide ABC transporter ATP-binding protein
MSEGHLLSVRGLTAVYQGRKGPVRAVSDVSFAIEPREIFGLVGESGSGKSTVIRALMGLLPSPQATVTAGEILFGGADLLKMREAELNRVRGAGIGMVFQDPLQALNPVMTIGDQIGESLHRERLARAPLKARILEAMKLAGIPEPESRLGAYPHELSGGLRQRAAIAAALIAKPALLLADEPTTALDVTLQAQILRIFKESRDQFGMSVLLVTHDLAVVAETCKRVAVMYAGRIVEEGPVGRVLGAPAHPYTRALLGATFRDRTGNRTRLKPIPGAPPDLVSPPSGCAFAHRCIYADATCGEKVPELLRHAHEQRVRCIRHGEIGSLATKATEASP